jgi:hypothetical protein
LTASGDLENIRLADDLLIDFLFSAKREIGKIGVRFQLILKLEDRGKHGL